MRLKNPLHAAQKSPSRRQINLCAKGVRFVLGETWLSCVPYLRILLAGAVFAPVTNISLQYIRAKGRSDLLLATDAVKKPVQFALLFLGVGYLALQGRASGLVVLCWTKVLGDFAEAMTDAFFAARLSKSNPA